MTAIRSVIAEYMLRNSNTHIGTNLGGNIKNFFFLQGKEITPSKDTDVLQILQDQVLYNQDFLNKDKVAFRKALDAKILECIGDFQSPVDDTGVIDKTKVSKEVLDFDVKNFDLKGLNLKTLSFIDKVYLHYAATCYLTNLLDTNPEEAKKLYTPYSNFSSNFDLEVVFFSIRHALGIERMVAFNLDEEPGFSELILNINKLFE